MHRGMVAAAALMLSPWALAGAQDRAASADTAVFAGGCYWGVEAVFEHVRGVRSVISGFALPDPTALGTAPRHTGFAEAVEIVYDPSQVTYEQLLNVLFQVAHDPTQLDRQGPDVGPQYRSAVFVNDPGRRQAVQTYLARLRGSGTYTQPVVTEVLWLQRFRAAGADQQDYWEKNPRSAYIITHDLPKIEELRRRFPALFRRR